MGVKRTMCIAIYKKGSSKLSFKQLGNLYHSNPDGCGMMWAKKNSVHTIKGVFDFQTFNRIYREILAEKDLVLHFRTASSGSMSFEKCHPFFVNDNLAFVENGNLFEMSNYYPGIKNDGKTDIQRLNEQVLQKFPANFLYLPEYRTALEDYCRNNFTKMIFMDRQGEVNIINEQSGYWDKGIWYSNGGIKDYPGYGFSGVYYYNQGDIRHKGGITNVNVFGEERRKNWQLCPKCLGYYRVETMTENICQGCNSLKQLTDLI